MDGHYTISRDLATGRSRVEPDIKTLIPEEITQHIGQVTNVIRTALEQGEVRMKDYLEYILPYRLAWEPVTPWFSEARNRYMPLISDKALHYEPEQLIRLCSIVNDDMKEGFIFGTPLAHARTSTWNQLMQDKTGDCFTMTHLVTYPLRAIGLPVTIDFIPAWGTVNGGVHAWNVVMAGNSRFIPFMGCETNPPDYEPFGIYSEERLPPKVFRKTFSSNPKSLRHLVSEGESAPAHLLDGNILDVTGRYLPVADAKPEISESVTKHDLVYLSVFSNGNWMPVFWPEQRGNRPVFKDMTINMLYLPVRHLPSHQSSPVHPPFILRENGIKQILRPDFAEKKGISLRYIQSKAQDELDVFSRGLQDDEFLQAMNDIYHDRGRSTPMPGSVWYLYYWDNHEWQRAAAQQIPSEFPDRESKHILTFSGIPSGALYRLSQKGEGRWLHRPFTYEHGSPTWW